MVLDHEFPPDTRVENEIESLISDGNEVHIACFTLKGENRSDQHLGAVIHRKPIRKLTYRTSVGALRFPFYFNFWRSFLKEVTNSQKFDAIHIHDLPLARVGYEIAARHGMKLTIDMHENWPAMLRIATHTKSLLGRFLSNNRQWIKYEKKYCNLADNIIVVVQEAKNRLLSLGIAERKVFVVSNTLNTKNFILPVEEPDQSHITLLYAGGVNIHRGLQYVIKGLKYLKDLTPGVRLQVVGSGSYMENLKKLAKSENVSDMVTFEGWKKFSEMVKYIGWADICLIPHVKSDHTDSTIPHKIFQYMYAGKPIIASNCSPIERIINATNSGMIYNYDDPEAFGRAVKHLIDNPEHRKLLSASGKQNVVKDYVWDIDSRVLNEIYNG